MLASKTNSRPSTLSFSVWIVIYWNMSPSFLEISCSDLKFFRLSLFCFRITRSSSLALSNLFFFLAAIFPAQLKTLSDFAEEQGMVNTDFASSARFGILLYIYRRPKFKHCHAQFPFFFIG